MFVFLLSSFYPFAFSRSSAFDSLHVCVCFYACCVYLSFYSIAVKFLVFKCVRDASVCMRDQNTFQHILLRSNWLKKMRLFFFRITESIEYLLFRWQRSECLNISRNCLFICDFYQIEKWFCGNWFVSLNYKSYFFYSNVFRMNKINKILHTFRTPRISKTPQIAIKTVMDKIFRSIVILITAYYIENKTIVSCPILSDFSTNA